MRERWRRIKRAFADSEEQPASAGAVAGTGTARSVYIVIGVSGWMVGWLAGWLAGWRAGWRWSSGGWLRGSTRGAGVKGARGREAGVACTRGFRSRELPHSAAPAAREQTRGAKTYLNYFIKKFVNNTILNTPPPHITHITHITQTRT